MDRVTVGSGGGQSYDRSPICPPQSIEGKRHSFIIKGINYKFFFYIKLYCKFLFRKGLFVYELFPFLETERFKEEAKCLHYSEKLNFHVGT